MFACIRVYDPLYSSWVFVFPTMFVVGVEVFSLLSWIIRISVPYSLFARPRFWTCGSSATLKVTRCWAFSFPTFFHVGGSWCPPFKASNQLKTYFYSVCWLLTVGTLMVVVLPFVGKLICVVSILIIGILSWSMKRGRIIGNKSYVSNVFLLLISTNEMVQNFECWKRIGS